VRTVLLTGNGRRHRFAARALGDATTLVGVVSEEKAPTVGGEAALEPSDQEVVRRHLIEREAAEATLLGPDPEFPTTNLRRVIRGGVNSPEVLAWLEALAPEVVVLYGTSVVREPVLGAYAGRLVNLHLGLSPYYRGSATNFWPLVRGQPECVGATIHLAVAQVDAGGILAQVRPEVTPDDRAHQLGTKALMAAVRHLPAVLAGLRNGSVRPVAQDLSRGQEFRRRDFGPAAVRRLWENLDRGMIREYVHRAAERCAAFPIVEVPG
jgi:methionyl-tRNA formyltransferase